MNVMQRMSVMMMVMMMIMTVKSQRRVVGDIREQSISQLADFDAREERVFRRPATYLILASKVVRPSSIYQVSSIVSIFLLVRFLYHIVELDKSLVNQSETS